MNNGFRLKGWHVLASLMAFFAVIATANAIFIAYAVRSFPGQQVEKSYLQGLHFNEQIDARERQAALGWSASIVRARIEGASAVFEVEISARNGEALTALNVSGELRRPASDKGDRRLAFSSLGAGRYQADASGLGAGAYDLSVRAASPDGKEFALAKRVFLK